jgi:hypothetical protein
MEQMVPLALKDYKVQQDQLVQLAHKEYKELLVQQDHKEFKDLKEHQVLMVPTELMDVPHMKLHF